MTIIKRAITVLLIPILFVSLSVVCTAHPGRTDSNGGHWDSYAHEYHYHHGHSAHKHKNGKCPYKSSTNTENNVTEDEDIDNSSFNKNIVTGEEQYNESDNNKISFWQLDGFVSISLTIVLGLFIVPLIMSKVDDFFLVRPSTKALVFAERLLFALCVLIYILIANTLSYLFVLATK